MPSMYIVAREISQLRTSAAMKLRLVRTYIIADRRDNQSIKCRECVFHDEEGPFVHANIPREHFTEFIDDFKEGNVYCVKNFMVVPNWYTYKTSTHRYMLKFYSETRLKHYIGEDFPRHMYRLKSFPSLKSFEGLDEKELIDVMGRVVEIYSPLDKNIAGRPSRLIDFLIEDLDGCQLKCTVWDHHVEKVLPFFNSDLSDPVIVLIQMCRVKREANTGEVKISSSYDATQLLFNQDAIEFVNFRESLTGQQTPLRSITSMSSFSYGNTQGSLSTGKMIISTITDVYERRELGDYWIPCKILCIESGINDWFYESCNSRGCNKKLGQKNGLYYCSKCETSCKESILRYKLKVRAVDANGNAPFLLWDRECVELLGMTAAELKAAQPKDVKKIPKQFKGLVGLGLVFKISVKNEQLENLHNAFSVMQMKNDRSLVAAYCPELFKNKDKDFSSRFELIDDDDEGFLSGDEAESPVVNVQGTKQCNGAETDSLKRCLLDEFSSTQSSKKTKPATVKVEKDD